MRSDPELHNPFFRKPITPWYDSNIACWWVMIAMIVVFAFSLAGIVVAAEEERFREYIGFPVTLAGLSLLLVLKTALRLRERAGND